MDFTFLLWLVTFELFELNQSLMNKFVARLSLELNGVAALLRKISFDFESLVQTDVASTVMPQD